MEYFFSSALFLFYKLLSLLPLVLILIALIKLNRKEKTAGTGLMLIGNLGLIAKIILLDSLLDLFTRFSNTFSVSNIGGLYQVVHFIAIIFSTLFGVGFLIFAIKLIKKID